MSGGVDLDVIEELAITAADAGDACVTSVGPDVILAITCELHALRDYNLELRAEVVRLRSS